MTRTEAIMFIFFDIDGTLLDQQAAERAAADAFLAEYENLRPEPYDSSSFCHRWRALREHHLRAT